MIEKRLDIELVERGEFSSREKAQNAIKKGRVIVDGKVQNKPAFLISENSKIEVVYDENYISRGSYKIEKAKEVFGLDFLDKVVLDIGASTGGFTDFSLRNGARQVLAVDVGNGELAKNLREDKRVINLENQDFRTIDNNICKDANMIIGDLSFISLRHIFPKIKEIFGETTEIAMLFKPQFECGTTIAKKYKGVIKDRKIHTKLLKDFVSYLQAFGYNLVDLTYSPITGKNGNIEYLFYINKFQKSIFEISKIDALVEEAFKTIKKEK